MKVLEFKTGDLAWCYRSGHKGDLSCGEVIHIFERHREKLYVLAFDILVDEIYEVRPGCNLSDAADKPIGMYRK
jgi:hypothetical protein